MAVTIGIFEQEEKVLKAIRLLREAGVEQDEIRVIVNNREGAPILASDGDVNLEEVYDIQEARGQEGNGEFPLAAAPIAAGYPMGTTSTGSGPAGVIITGYDFDEGSRREKILRDIGIPSHASEQCGKAVESGHYLLAADAGSDVNVSSLLSHAGAIVID